MAYRIATLGDVTDQFDVIISDVWGVLHNGVTAFPDAVTALQAARRTGKTVVLITNSPRPAPSVIDQLRALGVPDSAYDRIVTSGDVTRALIASGPEKIYFIGADKDTPLLDGLGVEQVGVEEAGIVVCAGLRRDEQETAEDYRAELEVLAARHLPLICANPDLVVERGHRLIPCAGALAKIYGELGGTTMIAGKPHRPIYEKTLEEAREARGSVDLTRVLAIGDGMPTDVRGAEAFGLEVLYVSGGIHAQDYVVDGRTDEPALQVFLEREKASPKWWMPRLQ